MDRALVALIVLLAADTRACGQVPSPKSPPVPTKAIPAGGRRSIDAGHAMRLAEEFVRANGYTDYTPPNVGKLRPEPIEMNDDQEEWIKERHNTVRPRAYGYRKGVGYNPDGWTVVFERTEPPCGDTNIGVGVRMDQYGKNIYFMHIGVGLNFNTRRPK